MSWGDADGGEAPRGLDLVTRSFPVGLRRGGVGLVETDHGLRFLVGQPEDQVVGTELPAIGFCSSLGSGFIAAAALVATSRASSFLPCRKRLMAR